MFENDWAGRLVLTHVEDDFDARLLTLEGIPDRNGLGMTSYARRYRGGQTQNSVNAVLNGDFEVLEREHQFVLGAVASELKAAYSGYDVDQATLAPVGNVFEWDGSYPKPFFYSEPTETYSSTVRQYGIYGTVQFRASDALTLLAGARVNWWQGKDTYTNDIPDQKYNFNAKWTPYVGVTYDLTPVWTAYGSVTSIYQPQLAWDADKSYLPPTYGWNYELGVKGNPMDGAMYVSAAIFQTDQKDVPEFVDYIEAEQRAIYRSIPGTTTRGFELEAAGALTDRWNVSAGYTFRVSEDKDGRKLYTDQPQHTLKVATDYRVPSVLDDRLTVGGAMRWQSATDSMEHVTSDPNAPNVHQPAYAVFDLNTSWEVRDGVDLTLSVNNIFNKKYYATTGFYDTVVYGDERNAELTLRARF